MLNSPNIQDCSSYKIRKNIHNINKWVIERRAEEKQCLQIRMLLSTLGPARGENIDQRKLKRKIIAPLAPSFVGTTFT